MAVVKQELVGLSEGVWERLRSRFEGLTDEEYLWEPAQGCWTVRPRPDGSWTPDWPLPRPEPEPFTTIAWRMWHLIDCYGEDRAPEWLDVAPQGDPIGLDDPEGAPPPTAAEALVLLERAHARWDAHLALVSEASLGEKVGAVGGGYADRTRAAYVLHMLDEFIHHSAEIALLRDLWRWQHPLATDALTDRAMRGHATVLDDLGDLDDRSATELVNVAASYGRWELVTRLVGSGVPPESGGRTPLHLAAGAGELDVVRTLIEHGADIGARDPEFHATPLQWARFLEREVVAKWLESQTAK
ncbi:MAG: DinB family protein [Acidimicrobiales bacterium]